MRIGYFGGSFDPPHRGHLAVACAARDQFGLDRVLLAPTGRQPLKPEGPTASFADRFRMTELLCAHQPGLEASPVDAPLPDGSPNYTADTLERLQRELPGGAALFAIVGADAFLGLPQWRRSPELLRIAEWIVVSRPGFALDRLDELRLTPEQRRRVHPLAGIADPASATGVRARLRGHLPCDDLVPHEVLEYIRQQRLYGA
ncbi:MAG TPA: nicotinate (nicotinamide) nucleotide adenylyltransferase [Acidobacteriaceae bacterium]|nr:nicotinate (nicotinamide) nucleotide adenylyltransferase [Acidobacteriaceae bacterium]